MTRTFKKKQKETEKTRKKVTAKERQLDRTLVKQVKKLTALQKELEKIKCKKVAVITVAVRDQKDVKKTTPNVPQKTARKASNPHKKVVVRTTKSTTTATSKKRPAPVLPVVNIVVTAAAPTFRSLSGRTVSRPRRFED